MKRKISACLVLYNEAEIVERCLKSIKNYVDEIIIIHDGPCKDNTIKVCKKYTKKIYVLPRCGEAEPHRQFSFDKAKHNWILQIDGDEFLTPQLQQNLRKLTMHKEIIGYRFLWNCSCGSSRKVFDHKLAFFRKDRMKKFYGIPHESVRLTGRVANSYLELGHKPKLAYHTYKYFLRKLPWTKIQAEKIVENDFAKKHYLIYFLKAPVWFLIYLILETFKYKNFRLALAQAGYNFFVWWNVAKCKLSKANYQEYQETE